jgi:enterochelin esterase-like enzyme
VVLSGVMMPGFGGPGFVVQAAQAPSQSTSSPSQTPPSPSAAAAPQRPPAPANQRPAVQSPVIEAGRITFNVYAPKAAAVTLRSGELDRLAPEPKPKAMTRGDNGVWTIAIGPVPPGIYDYSFDVDGVVMTDPESTNVFGNVRGSRGFVEVPGAAGQPRHDEWRDVPHGAVTAHWYDSKATSSRRRVHVYTPPGYHDAGAASRRYPMLVLLHGSGDNDSHWMLIGRANVIADNLIAAQKADPMIIVMPDGHPYRGQPDEARDVVRRMNTERMESDVLNDVIPLVERAYRVQKDRGQRAITGLSMGGGQSLTIGLQHPDRFAYIGGFSSAAGGVTPLIANIGKDANAFNERTKLLWIRIGKDDFLLEDNRKFIEALKGANIRHEYVETEGAHMWGVWRLYLADFMPRLFRNGKAAGS